MLPRLLTACAIVFVCGVAGVFAVGAHELHATADALEAQPRLDLGVRTHTTGGTRGAARTILLIGSDRRAGAARRDARSDTMMLVRLNPRAQAVTVLSVPRDLQVSIPGRGTAKLNAAYAYGGAALTVKTLQRTLGTDIDHVIDVDFAGFRALVDELGCVYTDVDRRYFNRNLGTAATNYAAIDIQAGYQRLCGADALDYVRYRHGDHDLVRAARQQDFLRQARAQVGVQQLLGDRHALLTLLGAHTRTDLRGSKQLTALAKLALDATGKPVQQIRFPATIGPSYVYASRAQVRSAVNRFLHPQVAKRRATTKPAGRPRSTGLVDAAPPRSLRARIPFLYPGRRLKRATYDSARAYTLTDAGGTRHRAYRLSIRAGVSEFYGVQGTDWADPPLLADPDERRRLGRRTFELFYDGKRLRRVALRTPRGTYWVSNTLTRSLTNAQMLAIARSLRRL